MNAFRIVKSVKSPCQDMVRIATHGCGSARLELCSFSF